MYDEELGEGVEIVEQTSREGKKFFGLRVWLKSSQALLDHSTAGDDDRSAITFWSADRGRLQVLIADMREAWIAGPMPKEPAP